MPKQFTYLFSYVPSEYGCRNHTHKKVQCVFRRWHASLCADIEDNPKEIVERNSDVARVYQMYQIVTYFGNVRPSQLRLQTDFQYLGSVDNQSVAFVRFRELSTMGT